LYESSSIRKNRLGGPIGRVAGDLRLIRPVAHPERDIAVLEQLVFAEDVVERAAEQDLPVRIRGERREQERVRLLAAGGGVDRTLGGAVDASGAVGGASVACNVFVAVAVTLTSTGPEGISAT